MEHPKQHSNEGRSVLLALVYRNPVIDCYLHLVCRYLSIYIYRYPNKKPRSRNSKIQHTEIRSLPSLQTDHDHDDSSSIESSDAIDEYLIEPNGHKLSFRECYHLVCDRNPTHVCMEHDLCKSEPQDKPENPTSELTKSIETNKTPVQVKKKPVDYS